MAQNIEIEIKYLLSKEDFERVLNYFMLDIRNAKTQTNYYFDTASLTLSHQKQFFFRVREYNLILEATLKTPLESGMLETVEIITIRDLENLVRGRGLWEGTIKKTLERLQFPESELVYLASLTTKRLSVPYQGGVFFFDVNTYADQKDYEVEYETHNEEVGHAIVKEFFENIYIDTMNPSRSKMLRAIEAVKKGTPTI